LPLKWALQLSDLKMTKVKSETKVPKVVKSLRSIVGKKMIVPFRVPLNFRHFSAF
jgi:hypothetical protein